MVKRRTAPLRPQATYWSQRRIGADLSIRELEQLTGIRRGLLSFLDRGRYVPSADEVGRLEAAYAEIERQREHPHV